MVLATSVAENEYGFTKIVGAKFKPTDSILVDHYLAGKVCGHTDGPVFQFIKEVDLYQCEPEQLSSYESYDFGDNPRKNYFFTTLKTIKTENGRNVDRSVADGLGFWKITGSIIDVKDKDNNKIGTKTSLAFYLNGQKTNWLMTEYRLDDKKYEMLKNKYNMVDEENKTLALCVVYHNHKKRESESKKESGEIRDRFYPSFLELEGWLLSDNEYGSNQEQQLNSHGSSDQIIQQQTSDSGMGCYWSQRNPAGITPIADQPPINPPSFPVNILPTCTSLLDGDRADYPYNFLNALQ